MRALVFATVAGTRTHLRARAFFVVTRLVVVVVEQCAIAVNIKSAHNNAAAVVVAAAAARFSVPKIVAAASYYSCKQFASRRATMKIIDTIGQLIAGSLLNCTNDIDAAPSASTFLSSKFFVSKKDFYL